MDDLLVPLLIFGAPQRRRAEMTERLLPAAVPGSVGQRLAFAAVVAQQQIGNREQAELKMVKEAAARFIDAEDLADHAPTLHGIYAALSEAVQATVVFNTNAATRHGYTEEHEEEDEEVAEALRRNS